MKILAIGIFFLLAIIAFLLLFAVEILNNIYNAGYRGILKDLKEKQHDNPKT